MLSFVNNHLAKAPALIEGMKSTTSRFYPVYWSGKKLSPYTGTLTTIAMEVGFTVYEENALRKSYLNTPEQKSVEEKPDSRVYQNMSEKPFLEKMEISTTLLSSMGMTLLPSLITGASVVLSVPGIATSALTTLGVTIGVRAVRKAFYKYMDQKNPNEHTPFTPKKKTGSKKTVKKHKKKHKHLKRKHTPVIHNHIKHKKNDSESCS